MEDIECPYCNHPQEINHDDGYGYKEDVVYQQECANCENVFGYNTLVIYHYNAKKLPCENGEQHLWKPTKTYPKRFTRMECEYCGDRRAPSEEEWKNILSHD